MAGGGASIAVSGADFGQVARALRAADPQLRKDLSRDIRQITTPLVQMFRASVTGTSSSAGGSSGYGSAYRALHTLSRGRLSEARVTREIGRAGLRATVARSIRAAQRDRGKDVGVTIRVATNQLPPDQRRLPKSMDRGQWRHPVYGNQKAWVTQTVTPKGWFTEKARDSHPRVRGEFNATVHHHAQRLARQIEAAN